MTLGFKTLTSKSAIWPAYQNPQALMWRRTSFLVPADGCNVWSDSCWNCGSTCTSSQNSFKSVVVKFLMWLCCSEIKPPFLQERAWSQSNFIPHSQLDDHLMNVKSYLIQIGSQNNCLVIYPSGKRYCCQPARCPLFLIQVI